MEEHEWKKLWQIIRDLEDEIGEDLDKTFNVSGTFYHENYSIYTDEVYRILCEDIEAFDDVKNTNLAKRMLKKIGINIKE